MNCRVVIKTGFLPIKINHLRKSTVAKGVNLVESKHVYNVEEFDNTIKGIVVRQTSVNLPAYKVVIHIDDNREVERASCECVAGEAGACKHIAAIVTFVNTEKGDSKTSQPQSWGKPSNLKKLYSKGKRMSELFPPVITKKRKLGEQRTINPDKKITKKGRKKSKSTLKNEQDKTVDSIPTVFDLTIPKISPLNQIMEFEKKSENEKGATSVMANLLTAVEKKVNLDQLKECLTICLLNQEESEIISNPAVEVEMLESEYFMYHSCIVVGSKQIRSVCENTVKQSESKEWFWNRKFRISASMAHKIVTRQKIIDEEFLFSILNPKKVSSPAITWGKLCEPIALEEFSEKEKKFLIKSGLIIHSRQPWLCFSPDSLILSKDRVDIVEVKCPYSCRFEGFIDDNENLNVKFLIIKNRKICLRPTCEYYTQVQLQMYIAEVNICHFYVYTPFQSVLIKVKRNEVFLKRAVQRLEFFYFKYYWPFCVQQIKNGYRLTKDE